MSMASTSLAVDYAGCTMWARADQDPPYGCSGITDAPSTPPVTPSTQATNAPTQATNAPTPVPMDTFTYSFPATTTAEFVHGLCVMGYNYVHAYATTDYGALSYTEHEYNELTGTQMWSTRNYYAENTTNWGGHLNANTNHLHQCAYGTFFQPNEVLDIPQGTQIDVNIL